MSYKILCDSLKCEVEVAIPGATTVPPNWILVKRSTGVETFCSDLCQLEGVRDNALVKKEPVETPQPSVKEAIRTVPREGYDRKRRELLSRHSLA